MLKISQNLLSISQFTKDNDYYFVFTSSDFYVKENKTRKILFCRVTSNGLYPIRLSSCIQNKLVTSPSAFSSTRVSNSLWYHRLGHPSHSVLQQLGPSLSVHGLSKLKFVCTTYQMGKRSKLPFQSSAYALSFHLELVLFDVWGYSTTSSLSGARFYVTFIDDFSRYCWLFSLTFMS